jgi:TolB-like protein
MRKTGTIIALAVLNTVFSYAQDTITLDNAIQDGAQYFINQIPQGSKLVVLNVLSDNAPRLADYIIDEMTIQIVNSELFTVVDRRNLESLREEMNFQLSGVVSDQTAQAIGKKLGAQSIISGYIEKIGNIYRLQIQSIEVETARIQGMKNYILKSEQVLNSLLGLRSAVWTDQNSSTLNSGITILGDYLIGKIGKNSKVAILNISSDNKPLSNYIIDAFTSYMVNKSSLIVVDRRNLEMLQEEMDFQMSGEVREDTAQAVGRKLGAQDIISGKIEPLGNIFRLQIQVIAVETAQIQGMQSVIIKRDAILNAAASGSSTIRYVGEDWKLKFIHIGARPGFSFHFYDVNDTLFSESNLKTGYSIDFSLTLAFQIHKNFSLQTELVFGGDSLKVNRNQALYDEYDNFLFNYDTTVLLASQYVFIPVLAKGTWRPSVFSLEILGGIYFSAPVGEIKMEDSFLGTIETGKTESPMGLVGGGSLGIKAGPGLLFLDARCLIDLTKTHIETSSFATDVYSRRMVSIGLGYSVGFFAMNGEKK